jgi:hypothetical protein
VCQSVGLSVPYPQLDWIRYYQYNIFGLETNPTTFNQNKKWKQLSRKEKGGKNE